MVPRQRRQQAVVGRVQYGDEGLCPCPEHVGIDLGLGWGKQVAHDVSPLVSFLLAFFRAIII